jgi:hypothetical protein
MDSKIELIFQKKNIGLENVKSQLHLIPEKEILLLTKFVTNTYNIMTRI